MSDFEVTGTFRKNLQAALMEELGIKIIPGQLEGPNENREWQGSLVVARAVEDPRNVAQIQLYAYLRLWAPFEKGATRSPNLPYDPEPLELMDAKLRQAIQRNQTGLGPWYQRLQAVEFDVVNQGLQATIFAYSANAALNFGETTG